MLPSRALPLSLLLMLAFVVMTASAPAKGKAPAYSQDGAHYVGSEACSRCHLEIAQSFAKASMGHSLRAVTPELLKTLPLPGEFYDANLNRHFTVQADNATLTQTEFAFDDHGKESFRNTRQIEWIIGTGENGLGALLRRDGYLFQAPLSYYTRAAAWNLSPGYEHGDLGFNRLIQPGCIYCHSGRPQTVAGLNGKYADPPFSQTSVGCENCHGPGSAHIEAMHEGADFRQKGGRVADPTIVNPAHLTGQLSDDICMSCHQVGDARVLQPGKTYQDFRPGEPLARTVAIFQIPPTRDNPPQDDHLEHYYSMSLSKCFRATRNAPAEKQLRCIRCHDPHVEPTAAEAPAWFNGKCLTCHTTASCTGSPGARQATAPADNCIGCHMPKREIRVISHSTATNHRIVRSPGEAFPDEAFSQATAAMPDLILLDAEGARGANAAPPAPIVQMQAYNLLRLGHPSLNADWLTTLAALEPLSGDNAVVQAALGHRDLEAKEYTSAIGHLQRALQIDPVQPSGWLDLAEAQEQTGQNEDALASVRRAVALDPFSTDARKALVGKLISGRHYEEAISAMEAYMKDFPEDDFMRRMLTIAREP